MDESGKTGDLQQRIRELERANLELRQQLEQRADPECRTNEQDQPGRILHAMADGICVLNREKEIEYVSPALEKQLGAVNGRKCFEYIYQLHSTCPWCRSQEVFDGRSPVAEQCITKGDRTYRIFDAPVVKSDGSVSMLKTLQDATEQRKAEEALRESEKKLRALTFELLAAQETERRRISKELHDGLGQSLTVVKLKLGFIQRKLSQDQGELRAECEGTLRYIDQVIENARTMSRDLSPSILEDLGLSAALRRLAEEFRRLHGIDFTVEMDRIDHLFSEKARIILYRILQEALTNIEKHARAKNASLTIRKKSDTVFFEITDDGAGFDLASALAAEKGLGLATINERVRMLGGSLRFSSRPGSGTCIRFEIPLRGATG